MKECMFLMYCLFVQSHFYLNSNFYFQVLLTITTKKSDFLKTNKDFKLSNVSTYPQLLRLISIFPQNISVIKV